MAGPHPFDSAIALQPRGDGLWQGHTSPPYANMIGPYGGVTAAQLLNAVLQSPQLLGEPVAFTVNYASAVADGLFDIEAKPARTNRSTQHWTIALRQQDQVVGTATAITAVRRPTWGVQEAALPQVPPPGDVPRRAGRGVEWVNRYAMHFIEGGMPHSWQDQDSGDSLTRMWVRDDPPRPLDFAALAALADISFPRLWLRRARTVPLGTVTMTVYFHGGHSALRETGIGPLLLQVRGQSFGGGYFDHAGQLWNEAGTLLATTHQLVYYKE